MSSHEKTRRVKLYKAGKQWLTAAIVSVGFFAGVQVQQAQADTTDNNVQTTQVTTNNNQTTNTSIPSTINGYTEQQDQNGNNVWKNSNGQSLNGWESSNNSWYRFNNGSAVTGWSNVDGNEYYFDQSSAKMATGDTNVDGSNYYFEPSSGHQLKGMVLDRDTHTLKYYDTNSGARQTTLNSNGQTYTFDAQTGNMDTSSLSDGLNQIAGQTYYFNASSQTFANNDWKQVNNQWYYFSDNGNAVTGWYQSGAGNWYYFNNDGSAKTGWFESAAGNWYYFDQTNAWALRGWQYMDNNWLHLDPTNAWQNKGWAKVDGHWFYFDDKGHMQSGLQTINGKTYDLQTEHDGNFGAMKTGWQKVNGSWYYFNNGGDAATGWYQSGAKNWYYFNNDGSAKTGWFKSAAGFWYYFDNQNAWALKGWQHINNAWYYFDPTNTWAETGWQKINGTWYYMDPTNAWMLTGTQQINGKTYHFNSNGSWADGWAWPFPQDGEGHFSGAQLFGVHAGGEFRQNGFHDGLDFGSVDHPGSEVHAIHGGTVKIVGYTAGLDWYCVVDTGEYLVVYQEAFASKSNIRVHEGQEISTGDVIGIRNTAHVHIGITRNHNFNQALKYSFTNNGTWLDPLQVIRNGINNG
ncbi:peptidoglycan DD-metalloendopeptidase family protein [Limosilactobacillus kribbianus]|uniref:peptidoglycan DD-metalloendopeptidase family protein n=1 Tax=Limosilactobacillus kribbianus TaxID=2982695 RepID=UPI002264A2ED|nr:peptidoglycan DD-metalloendopeptidase family protein [Limosilactobacillus kribbianus]